MVCAHPHVAFLWLDRRSHRWCPWCPACTCTWLDRTRLVFTRQSFPRYPGPPHSALDPCSANGIFYVLDAHSRDVCADLDARAARRRRVYCKMHVLARLLSLCRLRRLRTTRSLHTRTALRRTLWRVRAAVRWHRGSWPFLAAPAVRFLLRPSLLDAPTLPRSYTSALHTLALRHTRLLDPLHRRLMQAGDRWFKTTL